MTILDAILNGAVTAWRPWQIVGEYVDQGVFGCKH
jgi:hypothetical protein